MTVRLNPYVAFAGNARQAMTFYQQVLGGELSLSTFGEFGDPGAEGADRIMHAALETPDGLTIMGADMAEAQADEGITIRLGGDDDRLRDWFARLSEGGTVTVPLEKQVWGDELGRFTDRFGIPWMVDVSRPQVQE